MSRLLTGSSSIATTLRLFGSSVLLLASFQMARVATAAGAEADVIDLLSTGRIRTSATWCYKKPGPERCATTLHMKDGSLVLEGVGCGSFRVPVNGSNGRQSAKIDGNTITVSVTGKNGTGVNTYELSPDLTQCSHTVECPAGFQAKVFSCSVERNTPAPAVVQQAPPAKTSYRKLRQARNPKQARKRANKGLRRLPASRRLLRNPTWRPREPSRSKTRTTTAC